MPEPDAIEKQAAALGLARAFALFPDEVRAAAVIAAEEHAALVCIDNSSIEPR